ncbi:GLIPR1-like protein 1 isoform X2 [Monodelphis domestica]|uniref:GLIPR1-like protein 1 isoform X2 n=1 Tax=Monodelphis domestica TaxID=13616 RepID=UPI00044349CC|nr:GLIPR1-like protein 1 isoform X2 [Monodelphis domestica]
MFQSPPEGSQGLEPQPKEPAMILDQRFPWMWVLGLGLLATGASPEQIYTPPVTDPNFIEECVSIHNELREHVSPEGADLKYVTWDTALAKTARAWSKRCIFRHNSYIGKKHACHPYFKNVGENLWMGDLTKYVPKMAVTAWYNEGKHFDIGNNACSGVCGHFTQEIQHVKKSQVTHIGIQVGNFLGGLTVIYSVKLM